MANLRKQIHRVHPLLQLKVSNNIYNPMIVSIGPYHHGKLNLIAAEELKSKYLDRFVSNNINTKNLLKDKILKQIVDIRGCYAEKLDDKYDDETLALMMLACFILTFLEGIEKEENIHMEGEAGEGVTMVSEVARDETSNIFFDWYRCLGGGTLGMVTRDLMVLENQIPFYVMKLIINEEDKAKGKDQLPRRFLNWILFQKCRLDNKIPFENENPPLHFVEALHRMIVGEDMNISTHNRKKKQNKSLEFNQDISWSVMDLKVKGVTFKRSRSHSMRSIEFETGALYGVKLYLSPLMISPYTEVTLLNMIAYEMSPDSLTNYEIVSYTNFVKSLIASTENVKELQEHNILIDKFNDPAQVVKVFKRIETFGINNFGILNEVKEDIREHCRNQVKTFLAEYIHTRLAEFVNTRFSTPWSIVAFFAGIIVITLTFLQTYYTIHPPKKKNS